MQRVKWNPPTHHNYQTFPKQITNTAFVTLTDVQQQVIITLIFQKEQCKILGYSNNPFSKMLHGIQRF